jgi:hypothetical protein
MGKNKNELWKEAYKKCRLSTKHIQMAKELSLNPRSLIKNIPNPKQKWKIPVREWIEQMYAKCFNLTSPRKRKK